MEILAAHIAGWVSRNTLCKEEEEGEEEDGEEEGEGINSPGGQFPVSMSSKHRFSLAMTKTENDFPNNSRTVSTEDLVDMSWPFHSTSTLKSEDSRSGLKSVSHGQLLDFDVMVCGFP